MRGRDRERANQSKRERKESVCVWERAERGSNKCNDLNLKGASKFVCVYVCVGEKVNM